MDVLRLVMTPPYMVHTTKHEGDHNLLSVYQVAEKLCLKYPGNYIYWVVLSYQGEGLSTTGPPCQVFATFPYFTDIFSVKKISVAFNVLY